MALKNRALWFGFMAFTVNFSIWVLYAALGIKLQHNLAIDSVELGLLLASPVASGALLNVFAGYFAQRFCAKKCFSWQMLASLPPLLLLPHAQSFQDYIFVGIGLGVSGTAFTFGLSYIREHFSQAKTGFAMGVFGAGNAGAVITLGLSPILIDQWSFDNIGYIYATILGFTAIVFSRFAPSATPIPNHSAKGSMRSLLSRLQIWRFGLYYFFVFGNFLALLLWLPTYYVNAYDLDPNQAMAFCLVFVGSSSPCKGSGRVVVGSIWRSHHKLVCILDMFSLFILSMLSPNNHDNSWDRTRRQDQYRGWPLVI